MSGKPLLNDEVSPGPGQDVDRHGHPPASPLQKQPGDQAGSIGVIEEAVSSGAGSPLLRAVRFLTRLEDLALICSNCHRMLPVTTSASAHTWRPAVGGSCSSLCRVRRVVVLAETGGLRLGGMGTLGRAGNGGRPSKGDRQVCYSRPQRQVREACIERMRAEGYDSLSDYISAVLAREVGLPELAPKPTLVRDGEELPLTG